MVVSQLLLYIYTSVRAQLHCRLLTLSDAPVSVSWHEPNFRGTRTVVRHAL